MTRSLVFASGPGWAERAARWVDGDAVLRIGDVAGSESVFDSVIISADLHDHRWVAAAFAQAERSLAAGGRAVLLLDDTEPGDLDPADADRVAVALPQDVVARWRLAGLTVEPPRIAASFTRAADDDGAVETATSFQHAQLVTYLYRHPELIAILPDTLARAFASPAAEEVACDEHGELARLRREIAAPRGLPLGRVTARYLALRQRLRRRR